MQEQRRREAALDRAAGGRRGPSPWARLRWGLGYAAFVSACGAVFGGVLAWAFAAPPPPPRVEDAPAFREQVRERRAAEYDAASVRAELHATRDRLAAERLAREGAERQAAAARLALDELVRTAILFPRRGDAPAPADMIAPQELPIPGRGEWVAPK